MSNPLEFTGERFTPECVREIRYEHLHRYVFARDLVRGKRVLDAACGEGYGSAILARTADSVVGVDISAQSIEHARARYAVENLDFRAADCLQLPFEDDTFDAVVSFETLEHLEDHDGLLREFRRVLAPDGFLLLSSPDKAVYTDQQQNRNEFHVRELYRNEFEALLSNWFPAWRLWGQKLLFQSAIWSLDERPGVAVHQESDGDFLTGAAPGHAATYLLAICAADDASLPDGGAGLSLYDDAAETVYEHYHHEIRNGLYAVELLAEKDREIAALKARLEEPGSAGSWWRRLLGRS